MDWLTFDWSPIVRFEGEAEGDRWFEKIAYDKAGVYRLIALAAPPEDQRPEPLDRVCGRDDLGTLYIGYSSGLRNRMKATMSRKIPNVLASRFPRNRLGVSWSYAETTEEANEREAQLVTAYARTFGEAPPLNSQGNAGAEEPLGGPTASG